ncbi:hypothetical protein URH17368_2893 [Alicyclobacillus hesperidum URH17-3-68]|uniref:TasA family protein n=1 Tax=Alicyclobacillus hesperidum TaxID=89784 RepID=UPI000281C1FD|nr:TasA family protein [Alicyclobacillus hesperidum]EJY54425.1 hypothetical protein URH17368_2893 [Alicyclobacillus hesperidum URH17-3-68]
MNVKIKLAAASAAGLLSMTGLVGYGTYAMFNAHAAKTGNTFTAGTLQITPERDDVPQMGPMFYSSSNTFMSGVIPTGVWAPGDQHTRGLFLENNGSLAGQLTTLTATPADPNGNPLSSTSADTVDYKHDLLFANQANVIIWKVVAVNPSGIQPLFDPDDFAPGGNATNIEEAVDCINQLYQAWLRLNPTASLGMTQSAFQSLLTYVNHGLLQDINDISAVRNGQRVTADSVQVQQIISEPLINLVNGPVSVSSIPNFSDVINPGSSSLLAFTVQFDKEPPQGVDPNSMQGLSAYFNFGTSWSQYRNNH